MNKKIIITSAIILALASIFLVKFFSTSKLNHLSSVNVEDRSNVTSTTDYSATTSIKIIGTIVCLPHKNLGGSQTMECAIGLKDSAGKYFFLNYDHAEKNTSFISTGSMVEVTGVLGASPESRYQTDGTIFVSKIIKIAITENPATKKTEIIGASGIQGLVLLGPVCPVQRIPPDPNCADRPYQTNLAVTTLEGKVIANFSSNLSGNFKVNMAPGQYVIRYADITKKYPICGTSDVVSVEKGKFTEAYVYCDTGIR